MNSIDLKQDLLLLVAFMLSSAQGLYDEPVEYGTFRLIDSARRLLIIMEDYDLSDHLLSEIKMCVDEVCEDAMDDDKQRQYLEQIIITISQEIQNC